MRRPYYLLYTHIRVTYFGFRSSNPEQLGIFSWLNSGQKATVVSAFSLSILSFPLPPASWGGREGWVWDRFERLPCTSRSRV